LAHGKNDDDAADRAAAERPPRVAMLGSLPPLRGISIYCLDLALSVSCRAPVEFVTFKSLYPRFLYPGGELKDDATFPAIAGPGLTVRRSLTWYNPAGWLIEGVRIRADVLHAQHWSLPLAPIYFTVLLLAKLRGVKVVLTLHNVRSHERSRLYGWTTRALCRLADRCVVHSEPNYRVALRELRLPENKLRRIRAGVPRFLNDGPEDRAAARQALGLPADGPVVLCFGAIRPYKGIDVLLRAFARAVSEVPSATLLVAGQSWGGWKPLQDLADRLGVAGCMRTHLKYIPTDKVKTYFHAADLCVLPYTHFDGQSGAGLAAMAFGKPMIVSDVGGLPELVSDPRCVVPPNDADALAGRIAECLKDPHRLARMRDDAAELARSFSWDRIAEESVALYKSVWRTGQKEPHGRKDA
jgi:glycosyltransferase involved in cell wall biosynthesis